MFQNRHTRSAFTLIELLVIIAIIALLAAILFPVFGRARENARRTSCASNIKQMALGLKQYTQDYDERFPFGPNATNDDYSTGWAAVIQPYLKSRQIFQCPSDDDKVGPTDNPGVAGYTDYWYNTALSLSWTGGAAAPNYRVSGISEAALLNSSLTIMLGEGDGNNLNTSSYRTNGCTLAGAMAAAGPAVSVCDVSTYFVKAIGVAKGQANHLNGFNIAFADGHVKWQHAFDVENQSSASANIYNVRAGFKTSGNNPTFNAVSDDNR